MEGKKGRRGGERGGKNEEMEGDRKGRVPILDLRRMSTLEEPW